MILNVKYLTALLLYILIANFSIVFAEPVEKNIQPPVENSDVVEVLAESAALIDLETGTLLFDKNMNKRLYPASITKIMTTMLALEYGKLDETITFSRDAIYNLDPGSSHIGIKEGEQLTLDQALYGVMLMSANEVCLGIAEHIDGSVSKFAERMTNRAREIGAFNTNFTNPHGLHNDNHYTTAYDMALITREALKYEGFSKIIGTYSYQIPPTNKNPNINYLANQHKIFRTDSKYHYDGVIGGKTGFTDEAKYTLVTVVERNGITLIASVLKGETMDSRYEDTIRLLDYGFENFEYKKIFDKNTFSHAVPMQSTDDSHVITNKTLELYADNDASALVKKELTLDDIETEISIPAVVTPPVKKDEKIGILNLMYDGDKIGEVDILAKYSIDYLEPIEQFTEKEGEKLSPLSELFDIIPLIVTVIVILGIISFLIATKLSVNRRRYYRLRDRKYR